MNIVDDSDQLGPPLLGDLRVCRPCWDKVRPDCLPVEVPMPRAECERCGTPTEHGIVVDASVFAGQP